MVETTPAEPTIRAPSVPEDICSGDIKVSNKLPTKSDLEKSADLPILDVHNKSFAFKTLYSAERGARRVLILFIRHFFCGNCQEYLRTLCSSITPESLLALPVPTEIAIIGCGKPALIPLYIEATSCPFPIYCDPTKQLYANLGMTRTLDLGPHRPDYMQSSLLSVTIQSIYQGLKSGRGAFKGGDFWQVGGEFLFESGQVTWCHRMKNTRDHAEVTVLRKELGLDGERAPVRKRWSTNLTNSHLGRSLSNKRQSWSRSRSRDSREGSKEGSIMEKPVAMKQVKEEKESPLSGEGEINGQA